MPRRSASNRMLRRLLVAALVLALALFGLDAWLDRREAAAEARWPPDGRILDVGGQKVHVLTLPYQGERQGPPADIVLIHGAGGNWLDMTGSIAPPLQARFHVFVVDRPGHGWSAPLAGPDHGPFAQARLLHDAVKMVGARNPVVLGHSYGGAVALAWAELYPEETPALILLAPAALPWKGLHAGLLRVLGTPPAASAMAFAAALLARGPAARAILKQRIFGPDPVPPDYFENRGVELALRRVTQKAVLLQLADLIDDLSRLEADMEKARMPTEIVQGTADRMVSFGEVAPPLARSLPEANLTPIEGAGHMIHWAHRQAVLEAIHRGADRAALP